MSVELERAAVDADAGTSRMVHLENPEFPDGPYAWCGAPIDGIPTPRRLDCVVCAELLRDWWREHE